MPDYTKLHDLVSHRVSLEYDTGARIVGYVASCQPTSGPVQFVLLKKVELLDERDQARERAEMNAREQAELDNIGLMRARLGGAMA